MNNILQRLEKKGDLFLPTLDPKIALKNNTGLKAFI
jgi:hypothetical protein